MGLELLEFPLPHSSASSTVMPSAQSSEMHPPHTPQPGHHCCHHPPVRDVICSASGMIQRNPQFWNTWGIAAERRENWNAQALCRAKKSSQRIEKRQEQRISFKLPFSSVSWIGVFSKVWKSEPWSEWRTKWRLAWERKREGRNSCVGRWINSSSTEVTQKRSMDLLSHSWIDTCSFPRR